MRRRRELFETAGENVTVTKHGLESRWGHHGDSVVIFAAEISIPGGWDLNPSFPLPSRGFQSLPNVLLRDSGVARRRLNVQARGGGYGSMGRRRLIPSRKIEAPAAAERERRSLGGRGTLLRDHDRRELNAGGEPAPRTACRLLHESEDLLHGRQVW